MWYSSVINGIQFLYENMDGELYGAEEGKASELKLDQEDYIVRVEWKTARAHNNLKAFVKEIGFTTQKGKNLLAKGEGPEKEEMDDSDDGNCMLSNTMAGMNASGNPNVIIHFDEEETEYREDSYAVSADHGYQIIAFSGYADEHLNYLTNVYEQEVNWPFSEDDIYYDDYFSLINADKLTKIVGYGALVIDKLQFVYDNDDTVTQMHGNGGGERFEFVLDEDESINKLVYVTANCPFSGYGTSPVLVCIEFTTNKRSFRKGLYGKEPKDVLSGDSNGMSNTRVYTYEMEEGEELFCLAGLYGRYMGRISTVYTRLKTTGPVLLAEEGQKNSDGKTCLCINHCRYMDGKDTRIDQAVQDQVRAFLKFYDDLSQKEQMKCRLLPKHSKGADLSKELTLVEEKTVTSAMLSGQYTYISIRCHGTWCSCGNLYTRLFDVDWVRKNKKQIAKKMKYTTINLFCCECGFRREDTYLKETYLGLARELIQAGVRAVFAYSTVLCSWSDPYKSSVTGPIMTAFVCNADKRMIGENLSPDKAAQKIYKEYDRLLELLKANNTLFDDKLNFLTITLPQSLSLKYPDDFTKDGLIKTSDGVMIMRQEVNDWLDKNISSAYRRAYSVYVDLFMNRAHFCGPGVNLAVKAKRDNNQGEICADFYNFVKHDL